MVSIVVPVYKADKCLHYCIDSLLVQSYKNIEIILVDDGSPDESGNICDSYRVKDDRIKVIHKENGGVSSARNAGVDLARGDYIVFVDSDDYVEPGYIGSLVDAAEKFPNAGQIWCCFQTVAGYNYEEKNVHCKLKDEIEFYTRDQIMTLHNMWLDTMPFNKLYNLELIRHYQLRFDETLSLGEDWLFNLAYVDKLENASIIVIAEPLYNYVRAGNESLDHRYREDMLDIYRRLNSTCERYLRQWRISDEQIKLFYDSRFFSYDKVLRNTFCSTKMSKHEMYKWNNRLMKSDEFQEVLSKCTCYIHPLYRKAYKIGDYRLICFFDWIQNSGVRKMKKSISGLFPIYIKEPIAVFFDDLKHKPFHIAMFHAMTIFADDYKCSSKKTNRIYESYQRAVKRYICKHYSYIVDEKLNLSEGVYVENAPIWVFWWQGLENAPDIIRKCVKSIQSAEEMRKEHPIIIVTKDNFKQYMELPDYILYKLDCGEITVTHFSDILRMNLLANHGGLWLDATIFCSRMIPDVWFEKPIYTCRNPGADIKNISHWNWTGYAISTWKNNALSQLACDFFNEYWKKNDYLIDYYLIDYCIDMIYSSVPLVNNELKNIPKNNSKQQDLHRLFYQQFSEDIYNSVVEDNETFFHKLTWKADYPVKDERGNCTAYSYWNKLNS